MNNMAMRETISVYADTSVFAGMFDDKNPHGLKPNGTKWHDCWQDNPPVADVQDVVIIRT